MKSIVSKNDIPVEFEEIYKETNGKHKIIFDSLKGKYFWEENQSIVDLVNIIGLTNICKLFIKLGINKNNEVYRHLYRSYGYELFGYWEIFYFQDNNPMVRDYNQE